MTPGDAPAEGVSLEARLLVLDDDESVARTIANVGRATGMEARWVTTPDEFFALIDAWRPDILTIDLVMPEMDGVEVIRTLARKGCGARLILSSGVGHRVLDAARRTAAEHGLLVTGVLPKPFHARQLRDQLAGARTRALTAPKRPASSPSPVSMDEVEAAIEQRQFRLVYQPKVRCSDGVVTGYEALVRWQHPDRGVIMPGQFIPMVERSGMIDRLTQQVFGMGLDWLASGTIPGDQGLSVNVSAACLEDAAFTQSLQNACRARGVEPDRVTLELTETAAMRDPATSLAMMTQLRMMGFPLSIDDFGTGYSSMVQLVRLPFSEMKVDRSFVMTMLESPESRAVVNCVLGLARGLDLSVTAEGVEDLAVLPVLGSLGCTSAQGYAIARPFPPESWAEWTRAWREVAASRWPPVASG